VCVWGGGGCAGAGVVIIIIAASKQENTQRGWHLFACAAGRIAISTAATPTAKHVDTDCKARRHRLQSTSTSTAKHVDTDCKARRHRLQSTSTPTAKHVDMYEIADGAVEGTGRIVRVPALVIALESTMTSRGLPSQRLLLELDCVDKVEVMKATTPADFELADVAHPHVSATLKHWFNRVTVRDLNDHRQIACALSHIRAWTRCAGSNTRPGPPHVLHEGGCCTSTQSCTLVL
jgi:hypothetical protein